MAGACGLWHVPVDYGRRLWTMAGACGLWHVPVDYGTCLWTMVRACGLWQVPVDYGRRLWTMQVTVYYAGACGHFDRWCREKLTKSSPPHFHLSEYEMACHLGHFLS
ncbi:hypothetical protein ACOMHN_054769 [Nucella lapillus]